METTQKMTSAILEAVCSVTDAIQDDDEALKKVGPILLSTGVIILVQDVGNEAAAQVVEELAERIRRGDFDQAPSILNT